MFTESMGLDDQQKGTNQVMMIAVIIGLVAVVGIGMAFVKQSSTPSSTANPAGDTLLEESMMKEEAGSESMEVSTDAAGVKLVSIEAGAFYYKPAQITVKKGDTVRVTINSVDMMHDFTLDAFNVKTPVAVAGESSTVEFVADQVGSFEFYCSIGQHRAQGQVGTLIVTE